MNTVMKGTEYEDRQDKEETEGTVRGTTAEGMEEETDDFDYQILSKYFYSKLTDFNIDNIQSNTIQR